MYKKHGILREIKEDHCGWDKEEEIGINLSVTSTVNLNQDHDLIE